MQRRLVFIVVPVAVFAAYLLVRIPLRAMWHSLRNQDEPIVQKVRPRLNVMKRMQGAIIPLSQGGKTWFVKVTGTENEVEALEQPLQQFMQSMRFENPDAPTWTLPSGWVEEEPAEKLRYKTILTGPKEKSPEIAISFLPGTQNLEDNINRWRGQLGLAEIGRMDLEGFYRKEKIAGHDAILVDLIGPGARGKAKMPMAAMRDPLDAPPTQREPPFQFKAPAEWKEVPAGQFSDLAFEVVAGKEKASITVSKFGGDGGGLLANVNRWRDQLGLAKIDSAQLAKESRELTVAGNPGKLVDLQGKGADAKRILGFILPHGGQTYFFKLTGPADLAGRQKSGFEDFVKSVSFKK